MPRQILAVVLLAFFAVCSPAADRKAKNIVLFLADGTGIPTINAASIYGYKEPRSLFIQNMPYVGLSETSSASNWVTDSAAGMTAIVTGQKTHNGVIAQSSKAVRGKQDGEPLKSILEYAEERGLSTGVVSNSSMADATPAACYAKSNDRAKHGEIFLQILKPRFGDGVDVVIGPGRTSILKATAALGTDIRTALPEKGFRYLENISELDKLPSTTRRVVTLIDGEDYDIGPAVDHAIRILSRNPKGFFLMVESNNHSKVSQRDLDRVVAFDRIIRKTAESLKDTLVLFTADHSFDLRLSRGTQIDEDILPAMRVEGHHTAEEVLVAAQGPGGEQVRGIMPNTRLFHIMMSAYGWK